MVISQSIGDIIDKFVDAPEKFQSAREYRAEWWQRVTYGSIEIAELEIRLGEYTIRLSIHLNLVLVDQMGGFRDTLRGIGEGQRLAVQTIEEIGQKMRDYHNQATCDRQALRSKLMGSQQSSSTLVDSANSPLSMLCRSKTNFVVVGRHASPSYASIHQDRPRYLDTTYAASETMEMPATPQQITILRVLIKRKAFELEDAERSSNGTTAIGQKVKSPALKLGRILDLDPDLAFLYRSGDEPDFLSIRSLGQHAKRTRFICWPKDSVEDLLEFLVLRCSIQPNCFFKGANWNLFPTGEVIHAVELSDSNTSGTKSIFNSPPEAAAEAKTVTEVDSEWADALAIYQKREREG
ncbi:uncharacterized protein PAC_04636 [Phialocephala subalpina]|uniref:Uncharacterized protein n=1 Tax=Phialocephala subalpina TaxID=576137 RepID=A0A1L7WPQ2_9HELO|nr:uncharacterized protein PAC_04636 [Phialocephala subalpina]